LGIDLGSIPGITQNDASDLDSGANNLQNFPLLTSVTSSGGSTTIQGTFNSIPNTAFRIDFYSNAACDPSGNGEGAQFFDTTNVTTDANGNASINFVSGITLPAGKAITATALDPSGNTSEFSPCDSTNLSGSVQFSSASYAVLEDVGNAVVKVLRVGGSKGTLSIGYSTADGTATAGSDYTSASGTLVFADGETSKTILIPIANDGITEPDETVRLSLTGFADLETLGSHPAATIIVQGNNTPLLLFAEDVDVIEGNSGTTNAIVTVNLSAQTSRTVSVNYNSLAFTATSGVDFMPVSGTLTFGPAETVKTISVSIVGDTRDEFNENFEIVFSNAVNATIIYYPAIVILDDDPLPSLSITDVMVNEGNSGSNGAVFNVSLSAPSGKSVTVFFNTGNGTASAGSDYVSSSGSINFPAGQTARTITVPVSGDAVVEPNETFLVNLFSASNATISRAQGIGTILDDGQTPLQLILEDGSNQAAAVDSLLFLRDPFYVLGVATWLTVGSDPNTRLLVFVRNLQLNQGETASAVEVNLVNGSFSTTIPAEDVRAVPNSDFSQVMFRLPDSLPAGMCVVWVKLHGQSSNTGVFRVVQ
jgi:Calx-beta domain-containing protein